MSGTKHDEGKPRYDLLPPEALDALARVFTYGAGKYGDRNWEKGIARERLFAAAQRHLWAFWGGQDNDPESGLGHVEHAMANLAMLVAFREAEEPEAPPPPECLRVKHALRGPGEARPYGDGCYKVVYDNPDYAPMNYCSFTTLKDTHEILQ